MIRFIKDAINKYREKLSIHREARERGLTFNWVREDRRITKTKAHFAKMPFRCDHCNNGMDPEICEALDCGKPAEVWSYYIFPPNDDDITFEDSWDDHEEKYPGSTTRHYFIRCWEHRLVNDHRTPGLVDTTKEECLVYLALNS